MASAPRILVTGAGGFLGSAVLRALVEAGATTRALLGPEGAPLVAPPAGCEPRCGRIEDAAVVDAAVRGVEAVVHLAGPPSVADSFDDPAGFARAHGVGSALVADACRRHGVRRLVHISSADVYGAPERNPVPEGAPLRPRSPYAAAKVAAEAFVRAQVEMGDLEAVVLRLFSVYGPGASPASLLPTILRQARDTGTVFLRDLRPVRDYCHRDDVVEAIAAALDRPVPEPFRAYNVGSGVGTSVADLAHEALRALGSEARLRSGPIEQSRRTDLFESIACPARAAAELGWRSRTDLAAGIRRTVEAADEGERAWRNASS